MNFTQPKTLKTVLFSVNTSTKETIAVYNNFNHKKQDLERKTSRTSSLKACKFQHHINHDSKSSLFLSMYSLSVVAMLLSIVCLSTCTNIPIFALTCSTLPKLLLNMQYK